MGRMVLFALAFLGLLLLRADAQTGRRVALVIGNGTYDEAGALANPVNDALDIAAKLRTIGFQVIEGHDLGKRALERKIGEFSDARLSWKSTEPYVVIQPATIWSSLTPTVIPSRGRGSPCPYRRSASRAAVRASSKWV